MDHPTYATRAALANKRHVSSDKSAEDGDNLYDSMKQSSRKIAKLEQSLKAVEKERDHFREQAEKCVSKLQHIQAESKNKLSDDDHLISEWKQLRYAIKNWSWSHFKGKWRRPILSMIKSSGGLERHVGEPVLFLESPSLRPLLAQSMLWQCLEDHVFSFARSEGGFCWSGDTHVALHKVHKVLQENLPSTTDEREFHRWRTLTATLIEAKVRPRERVQRQNAVVTHIKDAMAPFATSNDESFDSGLRSIVKSAVGLDLELQKIRAVLQSYRPKLEFVADDEHAESYEDPGSVLSQGPVRLVIAPGLTKYGNADGSDEESYGVLVKSQILTYHEQSSLRSTQADSKLTRAVMQWMVDARHPSSRWQWLKGLIPS